MPWSFSGDKPIFQQIVDYITIDIVSGKYKAGDRLDAVRELAITAGVNPNTMQRALAAIEESGIIYTKRGDGRYVVEDTEIIETVKKKYVERAIRKLTEDLLNLGLNNDEIIKAVANELEI